MAAHSDGTCSSPLSAHWDIQNGDEEVSSSANSCDSDQESDDDMVGEKLKLIHDVQFLEQENKYVCTLCSKSFDKRRYVTRHIRKIHRHNNAQHQCPVCDRFMMQKSDLKRHLRTHSDDKEYSCTICGKSFTRKDSLVVHRRQHSNDYSYKCLECKKGFHSRVSLESHIRIHTGDRPFPCQICTATFRQKGDLTRHLQSHMGIKPYTCRSCGKTFGRNADLRRHQMTHFEEKPFSCALCKKGFTRKYLFTKHMAFHETNEELIESNNNQISKSMQSFSLRSKAVEKVTKKANHKLNSFPYISATENDNVHQISPNAHCSSTCSNSTKESLLGLLKIPPNSQEDIHSMQNNIQTPQKVPTSNRRKKSKPTKWQCHSFDEEMHAGTTMNCEQTPLSYPSFPGVKLCTKELPVSNPVNSDNQGNISPEIEKQWNFSNSSPDVIGILPLDLSFKSSRHMDSEQDCKQIKHQQDKQNEDESFIVVD